MARPRVRPSKLPPAAASRKLVGNPKEGNQYGTDAQLDALRESLKVQMRQPQGAQDQGQQHLDPDQAAVRRQGTGTRRPRVQRRLQERPRDANIPKNPKHG